MTEVGVISLGKGCPLLRSVSLFACQGITYDGISALEQGYPLLKSIGISEGRHVTDVGMLTLGHGCPFLVRANFSNCRGLPPIQISAYQSSDGDVLHSRKLIPLIGGDAGVSALGRGVMCLSLVE